jgi:hypothetical protein
MDSVWIENGRRTSLSHELVRLVDAGLAARGLARTDRKAVIGVTEDLDENPAYKTWTPETLRRKYYKALPLPVPLSVEEGRWTSILMEWGKETKRHPRFLSAEQAREIINRLIRVAPPHRRGDLDQLFVHMSIHRTGREKINWLLAAIDEIETNPSYWPIPFSRRGRHDVTAGKIEAFLAKTPGKSAHKEKIASGLKILPTTCQTTLCSMERAKRIIRVENGVYALPMEGVRSYVPTDEAILDALAKGGERSCAELKAETGKSEGAIHAGLHRLAKRIVRTKRGRYALTGNAPPHVYARDAISDKMRSRKKMTIPELMAATGKNYGEIYQALQRENAKCRVRLIRVAPRGQLVVLPPASRRT